MDNSGLLLKHIKPFGLGQVSKYSKSLNSERLYIITRFSIATMILFKKKTFLNSFLLLLQKNENLFHLNISNDYHPK